MEKEIKKIIKHLDSVEGKFKEAVKAVNKSKNLDQIAKNELITRLYQTETKIYKMSKTLGKELAKKGSG